MTARLPLRVGVLGAGAIAEPYFRALRAWPQVTLIACASRGMASARAMAERHAISALTPDALLADRGIDVVVNLTPIHAHFETSMAVLAAGKHLYSEKPLAARVDQGRTLIAAAAERGLRIGCAPDTFLGSAHQEARAVIDSGRIGKPIGGALFLGAGGVEAWHPNPEPFYADCGGPVADHAPYYLTQLVNLLGPVSTVAGMGSRPAPVRTLGSRGRLGETIFAQVDTTAVAVLELASGALVTLAMSWDMGAHGRIPLEIYGTRGSLQNPDPNWSDGPLRVVEAGGVTELDHSSRPFSRPTMITFQGNAVAYYRLCGLIDMVEAIARNRPHRASAEMALHVLEVIEAVRISGETGGRVPISSRCEKPAALADDIAHAGTVKPLGEELLDARTLF